MKTVFVTGSNRGIGLELCRLFKEQGYQIIASCRQKSSELMGLGVTIIENVDVTNHESLQEAGKKIADKSIDLLINNAGVLIRDSYEDVTRETILQQMEINAIAPLLVTQALLKKMKSPSKIAMITSRMGSIADNGSGGYYGYRASKAALNAIGKSLSIDLKKHGIAVGLLHPGYVQTRMVNFNGDISAAQAASNLVKRIDELSLENSGSFWHANGESLTW